MKKRGLLSWVMEFAGRKKSYFGGSVVLAILGVAASFLPYLLIADIVGNLLAGNVDPKYYIRQVLLMTLFWIVRIVLHNLSTTLSHVATFNVLGGIRRQICEKLSKIPLGSVLDDNSGSYKNIIVERVDSMETTLAHIIPEFTANILLPLANENRGIIEDVSLDIKEKTTTAIVGPSGGGKTTITSLIARFWDVQKGKVTLGGRNVKDYSFDSLMENFSFVFQRVYLFEDTIANNIRFGRPEAPMEEVIAAAKKARCHDFISSLPEGYDTVIGEGGATISGGEKQRISIARAIMKDAPIIVLDEATANVDPENEKELTEAIENLTQEKTIIMIAHRLKTVKNADQIVVIDKGRIAQKGRHEELMQEEGIYRNFVSGRRQAVSWKIA